MKKGELKQLSKATLTGDEIISSKTDPDFYSDLEILPNPDVILRKMGKIDEVHNAIQQDAHVAGEIRSARSGLLKFETKLTAGGDSAADKKALKLCQMVMNNEPAKNMLWSDVFWNMARAQYMGFIVHEIIWQEFDGYILPSEILDRKNRRFDFSHDGKLLVRMRGRHKGDMIDDNRVLLTRHQPSAENPYGVSLFSCCFWPYTFKHSAFRSFTKYVNKYGLPWAIGKYPQGTTDKERSELVQSLSKMVEDAVAAVPDGNSIELIETQSGKQSPQPELIRVCNSEMSKALTSQTMATEQGANGSRAAAETARGREESVDSSQRVIIEATMDKLFRLITNINLNDAMPPTFKFYEKDTAPTEWVAALEKASGYMDVSRKYAHKVTGIPMPENDDDKITKTAVPMIEFARDKNAFHNQQDEQTQVIYALLGESVDMADFQKKLDNLKLDDGVAEAMQLTMLDQLIAGRNNV